MQRKFHIQRPEAIGKRLEITRLALGFPNQKDFYAPVGIVASAASMWESGDRYPRVEHAMKLCQEYDLSLDWIYRGLISKLPYGIATRIKKQIEAMQVETGESLDFTVSEIGA